MRVPPEVEQLPPARLPDAAHAGPAQRRARAGISWRLGRAFDARRFSPFSGHGFHTRPHLVQIWLARGAAFWRAGAKWRDLGVEGDTHLVERGLLDPTRPTPPRLALRPSPCRGG